MIKSNFSSVLNSLLLETDKARDIPLEVYITVDFLCDSNGGARCDYAKTYMVKWDTQSSQKFKIYLSDFVGYNAWIRINNIKFMLNDLLIHQLSHDQVGK